VIGPFAEFHWVIGQPPRDVSNRRSFSEGGCWKVTRLHGSLVIHEGPLRNELEPGIASTAVASEVGVPGLALWF